MPKAIDASTWIEVLRTRASRQPEREAYIYLSDGAAGAVSLTYEELDRQARRIAAVLQASLIPGERALLVYPSGLDLLAAFFGCLYAGVIAVPVDPPQSQQHISKIEGILADAAPEVALTTSDLLIELGRDSSSAIKPAVRNWMTTDDVPLGAEDGWAMPPVSSDSLCALLYTSGSTGSPKGVMHSHQNSLHNIRSMESRWEYSESSVNVSWILPTHSFGFKSAMLQPLYTGFTSVLMSPDDFLQNPHHWLQAISIYRATTSGAPNFAYELCLRRIPMEERLTLDLTSWRIAINAGEPVRAETLDRFVEEFGPFGFRKEAWFPSYGMTEGMWISTNTVGETAVVRAFDRRELEERRAVPVPMGRQNSREVVSCGRAIEAVRIIDPVSLLPCEPGKVGEIWVSGSSLAKGYWKKDRETKETFHARLARTADGPFLRTGDLGILEDDHLFVTGRIKEMIVIRGKNHYPQDIELTVLKYRPSLRLGAAFSIDVDNEEQLVIVQEVADGDQDAELMIEEIRQAITEEHGIQAYAVVLVRPGAIPRTLSGKIQRDACRRQFLKKRLDTILQDTFLDSVVLGRDLYENVLPQGLLWKALWRLDEEQRLELLETQLQIRISQVLGTVPSAINSEQSLTRQGADSLRAAEMASRIEADLGIDVAPALFLQARSIRHLAKSILDQMPKDA